MPGSQVPAISAPRRRHLISWEGSPLPERVDSSLLGAHRTGTRVKPVTLVCNDWVMYLSAPLDRRRLPGGSSSQPALPRRLAVGSTWMPNQT